jgi:hypothetical protein
VAEEKQKHAENQLDEKNSDFIREKGWLGCKASERWHYDKGPLD